ncbi:response regulator transcription factor [Paenibacillus agricola]|uniref:Helix-turn-helix domain-containing protein n=1 Tax=Paenibacillus agricola TaxID=2716264 RepID=A0ABX0JB49_9BACL|nr:helix-turn-helix domain-containing protein [Paenibacillus agricola]NHN32620.1 helix-turn-helix domain-containing protein [Paenibacillus agricola]
MLRIIFVDDEPWALTGIKNIIDWNKEGFEIIGAFLYPRKALESIMSIQPDIVFTDIRMPGMTGLDLVREAREKGINSEFVIISAFSDFEVAREALQYDVFHYILKPLDRDEVGTVVDRLRKKLVSAKHPVLMEVFQTGKLMNERQREVLVSAAVHPHCYIAVAKDYNLPKKKDMCVGQFLLNDGTTLYLLSSKQNLEPFFNQWRMSAAACGVSLGISVQRPGFEDFDQMFSEAVSSAQLEIDYSANSMVAAIQVYLSKNYKNELSLSEISERFYLSETYLCELFKKQTGITLTGFLTAIRMKRAALLLVENGAPVQQVADMVGYSDYGYFGRLFKRFFGCTPSKYRKIQNTAIIKKNFSMLEE